MEPDEYAEAVLALVEQVPPGRVTTYGAVADCLTDRLGRGGARQVGNVMAALGGGVPWWRVIRSDGTVPAHLGPEALQCWWSEGTPLRPSGRVDLAAAFWAPETGPDSGLDTGLVARTVEELDEGP